MSLSVQKNVILRLYQLPQTVFTTNEVALLFPELDPKNLRRRLSYYVTTNQILRPTQSVYTKLQFNELELANKLYSPSYVSFHTVLQKEGVVFQFDSTVQLA